MYYFSFLLELNKDVWFKRDSLYALDMMKIEIKGHMSWPKYHTLPRDIAQSQAQSHLLFSSCFWDNLEIFLIWVHNVVLCHTEKMIQCHTEKVITAKVIHGILLFSLYQHRHSLKRGSIFGIKLPYNAQLPSWGSSLSRCTLSFDCLLCLLTVPQMEVLSIRRLIFVWANEWRWLVNKQQLS